MKLLVPLGLFIALGASALGAAPASAPAMFRYSPTHTAALAGSSVDLGGLAWSFTTGGSVRSTPAVAAGLAIFGSGDGNVYALDVITGAEKWHHAFGAPVTSSPAIVRDRVVLVAPDGRVCALRLDNGAPRWTHACGADVSLGADPRTFEVWDSSPTIVDGTVFTGSGDGKVYALDLDNGNERWAFATQSRVRSSPAVVDGAVYVGSFDGNVYALDAATGKKRWQFATGDVVQSSPAVADGLVYVGSRSMSVYALDAATGALRWHRVHSGSWILASPAVGSGKVIIGGSDSHRLDALDAKTGKVVWSSLVGARILGSVTIVGDAVIYGAEDFRVYTLDLATGLGRSQDFTEGAIYSSPVLTETLLFAGSDDRRLYAFQVKPATPLTDTASDELRASVPGTYRTADGLEFTVRLAHGRLALGFCTFPPALLTLQSDGTLACPMLWSLTGKLRRDPGRPASALALTMFGQESLAVRVD